ncbi:DUF421 domain-containing protein [Alkalibacillus haloalkaliphilus]|uniref:DUF421 domain-containing protein n=1 Tax=Alkalibacillus haloalkaliphilus TaxID=94136 RepID=UPI00030CB240|nr:DUF421 domain-containing protein [Alkalibacillus haloalkaliphilus]
MNIVFEALIMVLAGLLLLRLAGRKSISQMTLAQTVVMISIGSIIIQPIVETSLWKTTVAAAVFILTLMLLEYLQIKFNAVEKFITGKSKVVIENGVPNERNLKKLRITVDQLEIRLRQQGISSIADVSIATLEANGQLGYELIPDAKPLTVKEFKRLMNTYMNAKFPLNNEEKPKHNIFEELTEEQDSNTNSTHYDHPDHLK